MAKTGWCLVALALAAGARAVEFDYVFDTSGAPELAEWTATKLAPAVKTWYPKLAEMFASDGWKPHGKVTFRYKDGLDCPAYTAGAEVTLGRAWINANPGDVGCAIHELFHVVQSYRKAPGWVTEGLADYARWYLFEPEAHGCDMDVSAGSRRYDGAYRVSANFLDFVEKRHPGTLKALNARCRKGAYDEKTFWPQQTGETVAALEDAWKGRRAAAQAPAVRVMTYNVRCEGLDKKSKDRNWKARRVDLAHLVERENPDVMGFQEVEPGQLEWLKERFGGYAFVGRGRNANGGGEASPVAFRRDRFAVAKEGTFWLSETPDVPGSKGWDAALPRICSYAVLKDKATGKTFSFANTHTDHKGVAAREKGMLLVIERMKAFGGNAPIVFTGDHNCLEYDAPALAVSKILTDALYLSKTPPEGSWRTFNFWNWREQELSIAEALKKDVHDRSIDGDTSDLKRIDYIYVSPGTTVLDYRTVAATRPNRRAYPSDHFPSVATLVFK